MHIPKKKFGQNFLVNKEAKSKLAVAVKSFVEITKAETILEIGPGLGDLTEISCKILPVIAVEIDFDIVEKMEVKFQNNFSVVNQSKLYLGDIYQWQKQILEGIVHDINQLDYGLESEVSSQQNVETVRSELLQGNPPKKTIVPAEFKSFYLQDNWVLISNLPYNLGSRILVDMAILRPNSSFLVILQEEVVDKLVNLDKHFTFFGAWLNIFYSFKKEVILPRHYFNPQPNVTSALVSAVSKPLPSYLESVQQRLLALSTLKKLFAFPSKTIYNNLRQMNYKDHEIHLLLNSANIQIQARLNKDNYLPLLHKILGVDKV